MSSMAYPQATVHVKLTGNFFVSVDYARIFTTEEE